MSLLDERIAEFDKYVWIHTQDPFQNKFDTHEKLPDSIAERMARLFSAPTRSNRSKLRKTIGIELVQDMDLFEPMCQLVGLTLSKVKGDIKANAMLCEPVPKVKTPTTLIKTDIGQSIISDYFAEKIENIYIYKEFYSFEDIQTVYSATNPSFVRQKRAKLMGHEIERRLAFAFHAASVPFEPIRKVEKLGSSDVTVDGYSYDLVSPSVKNALLRILCMVHNANVGQYGEDKLRSSAVDAKKSIKNKLNTTLLTLIDGLGCKSNRAGLAAVLENSDEFCQLRTLWKAVAIGAKKSNIKVRVLLPENQISDFAAFADRWSISLDSISETNSIEKGTEAGDGILIVNQV